jgi:hypothetical protein
VTPFRGWRADSSRPAGTEGEVAKLLACDGGVAVACFNAANGYAPGEGTAKEPAGAAELYALTQKGCDAGDAAGPEVRL